MAGLTHAWIREFYTAALQSGSDDFARAAMRHVAAALCCDAMVWQAFEADAGGMLVRAVPMDDAISAEALAQLPTEGDEPTLTPGWSAALCPVEAVSRRVRHRVWFLRRGPAFVADERGDLAAAAVHLVGAEIIAREHARRLAGATDLRGEPPTGEATFDGSGRLVTADARFRDLLRSAMPGWDGAQSPVALDGFGAERTLTEAGLVWRLRRDGDRVQVRVRHERRASLLSTREQEIAGRVAQGMTFKEIARELNLAQSTVSTHVYNIYAKLGIRRRYDLVQWLSSMGPVLSS